MVNNTQNQIEVTYEQAWDSCPIRHQDASIIDGTEAVLLFLQAFSINGDPNKKDSIDCSCISETEDWSLVFLD